MTGMLQRKPDGFRCTRCARCCGIPGAYEFDVDPDDLKRWEEEGEFEIFDHLDGDYGWVKNPDSAEEVGRCPFLRKDRNKPTYHCRIHGTKPLHCRLFPLSANHAMRCRCPNWRTAHPRIEPDALGAVKVVSGVRRRRYYFHGDESEDRPALYFSHLNLGFMPEDYFRTCSDDPPPEDWFELGRLVLAQFEQKIWRPTDAPNFFSLRM